MLVVNSLFEDLNLGTGILGAEAPATWRPATDIYECDNKYIVRMAVSGLRHRPNGDIENATVTIKNDLLIIRGHRLDDCPHKKHTFHQMEIHYGPFECRIHIHAPFDRDNVRAEYRNGFLNIIIPKAPEITPGAHTITVRSGD